MAVPEEVRSELQEAVSQLEDQISQLKGTLKPPLLDLLPDVEIFHKAVEWPLTYNEFYRSNEFAAARSLLKQGMERARKLRNGETPWVNATGLVVRGYLSKIDGSVQPYGLVVPSSYRIDGTQSHRLDVWLHGRDDHLTELKFLSDRQRSIGEFAPPDAFVLHPYGRYCNAFKFAGEADVFEALEHVRKNYPIDERRLALRGFSMGGAGCWHLAAHHPGLWAVAAPGAGFAETAQYTGALLKDPKPPWYEQTLWRLYDSVDYAANFFNCPVVAYSGEIDKQKQAADMMAIAMKREGLDLDHVIGPNTAHKYEPQAKLEVARRVDAAVARGRVRMPREVRFTTWTLRYNQSHWVAIQRMDRHWERARVHARLDGLNRVTIETTNVADLLLAFPAGISFPARRDDSLSVEINGQSLIAPVRESNGERQVLLRRIDQKRGPKWVGETKRPLTQLAKLPGLQGPIDDAFMESFLFVRPTGKPLNAPLGVWTQLELTRATNEWRAQFRGLVRLKDDQQVTDTDIAAHNLILWGDPQSNKLIGRTLPKLPLKWNARRLQLAGQTYDSTEQVPVLIYPNPLNPRRYIVLNSGFTFADTAGASNAQQTPKLPDYAVLTINAPPEKTLAQRVLQAGFFDDSWHISGR